MPLILLLAMLQTGGAPGSAAPGSGGPPAAAPSGSLFDMLVPMALIGVVIWFFMIQPERKARKRLEELRSTLKKGDKVITSSGMHGTVAQVHEGVVTLQVDEGVRIKFSASAIQNVIEDKVTESAKS
jgi:preprotein translocase subunit YajC